MEGLTGSPYNLEYSLKAVKMYIDLTRSGGRDHSVAIRMVGRQVLGCTIESGEAYQDAFANALLKVMEIHNKETN